MFIKILIGVLILIFIAINYLLIRRFVEKMDSLEKDKSYFNDNDPFLNETRQTEKLYSIYVHDNSRLMLIWFIVLFMILLLSNYN